MTTPKLSDESESNVAEPCAAANCSGRHYTLSVNPNTTEAVRKLVTELDTAIPKDPAQVQLLQWLGGPDEGGSVGVVATQQGYLRLGVEFLRAAYAAPSGDAPTQISVDLDYLLTDDSDTGFGDFRRVDSFPAPPVSSRSRSWFSPAFFLVTAAICVGILTLVGFATIIRWLFHS